MFKNYLKIAWRNLFKNKQFSIITIFGLTVGLWACMCVTTVVVDDLSYDTHWKNTENVYRILSNGPMVDHPVPGAWAGLRNELPKNFPEVGAMASIYSQELDLKLSEASSDNIRIDALTTDSLIWEVLDFKVLRGNPKRFLHGNKKNLVITEGFRKRYFPNEDPIGKILYSVPTFGTEVESYPITGVIDDIPPNTHLRAQALLIEKPREEPLFKQGYGSFAQFYITLSKGTDAAGLAQRVNKWYAEYTDTPNPFEFNFQPIKEVYLHSPFEAGTNTRGDYITIYILAGVALMLLVIACVNYVNLSVGKSIYRMREIGARKVLGANNGHILLQYLTESLLFFAVSAISGTLLYLISLPTIIEFLGHGLEMTFLNKPLLYALMLGVILLVSLLVGAYPAFMMSRFKPVNALKGRLLIGKWALHNQVQKGLVVLQFVLTVVVLISFMVVGQQLSYMHQKDLGYDSDNLLAISPISWDGKGEAFKKELLELPGVKRVSFTKWMPKLMERGAMTKTIDDPQNPGEKINVSIIEGDIDLPRILGLRLKKGRLFDNTVPITEAKKLTFSNEDNSPSTNSGGSTALVTEFTAKRLNIDAVDITHKETETVPVGVVEHFNKGSLHKPISPTIIQVTNAPEYSAIFIKTVPGQESLLVDQVYTVWQRLYPEKRFDPNWVHHLIAEQYHKETKLRQLFIYFTLLSMGLSALGIFGLVGQQTAQRAREVGVRKVLGASVQSIVLLFSKHIIPLLLSAIVIGGSIAWYGAVQWLENYAYRVNMAWWIGVLAGGAVIIVALTAVVFQTVKAAIVNPVKSLRTE
ncbi:MAG: FtsX-like permease family protein [Bacteroidota bacterium]